MTRDPEMVERAIRFNYATYGRFHGGLGAEQTDRLLERQAAFAAAEVRRALVEELERLRLSFQTNAKGGDLERGFCIAYENARAVIDERLRELRRETEQQGLVQLGSTGDCGSPDAGSSHAPLTTEKTDKGWEDRARKYFPWEDESGYSHHRVVALQLGREMADARAEEIAEAVRASRGAWRSSSGELVMCVATAEAIARSTIAKPKTVVPDEAAIRRKEPK